ncbi:MAG: hypothetical protein IPJ27_10735 [Candidatus Accumulibacter sp.]|uniref:Uncharacterized protein n=1 Tax=Candidatus Accumulibacter proximus TaxID=2954385 RepID=A0A935PZG0_9PROT|nr:hypothetical protein [Candidatus Accumulibacter proximus]
MASPPTVPVTVTLPAISAAFEDVVGGDVRIEVIVGSGGAVSTCSLRCRRPSLLPAASVVVIAGGDGPVGVGERSAPGTAMARGQRAGRCR